jgi:cytidylate kinase
MKTHSLPLSLKNQAHIAAQSEEWRTAGMEKKISQAPFITISRQFGCGAFPLAEAIADQLMKDNPGVHWAVYDRELIRKIAEDNKLSEEVVSTLGKKKQSEFDETVLSLLSRFTPELKVYKSTVSTIRALAAHGNVIIIGRGGAILTKDMPGGLHLRLIAPLEWRVERVMKIFEMGKSEAKKYIVKMDAEREAYIKKYLNVNVADPLNYQLIFNNASLETEKMVKAVAGLANHGN